MNTIDQKRYLLILTFLLMAAFFFRFIGLGSAPLSESEARLAMQSWSAMKGLPDYQIRQPLYVFITSVCFSFFDANEFTARVFPAIMGLLLVCLPILFHHQIGLPKTSLLVFFLAIDPVGIAWSKTADSLIPVICLFLFSITAFYRKRTIPGIILLALAMTGGERFWPPAAAILISFLFFQLLSRRKLIFDNLTELFSVKNLILLTICFILFSIGFFRFPYGLHTIGQGLLAGFAVNKTGDPKAVRFLPILIGYLYYFGFMLLLILLKFVQLIRSKQISEVFLAAAFVTFALLMGLFQQGILALAWISIPLIYFCSGIFVQLSNEIRIEKSVYSYLAIATLPCLYCFLVFRITELLQMGDLSLPLSFRWNQQLITLSLTRFQGYLFIIVICLIIFGVFFPYLLNYFSPNKIWSSFGLGILLIWLFSLTVNSWSAAGFRYNQEDLSSGKNHNRHELALGAQIHQMNSMILDQIQEIGLKQSGFKESAKGLILNLDEPMMDWELRKNTAVQETGMLNHQTELPSYVITTDIDTNDITKDLIGTPFVWKVQDEWNSFTLTDWLKWMLYRQVKENHFMLTFWQEPRWITEIVEE